MIETATKTFTNMTTLEKIQALIDTQMELNREIDEFGSIQSHDLNLQYLTACDNLSPDETDLFIDMYMEQNPSFVHEYDCKDEMKENELNKML